MAKWADYLISGVWFIHQDNSKHVSHVMLHIDNGDSFARGIKTSEADVIKLLKANKSIITITWNYPDWSLGAKVTYETLKNGREYLRTVNDASEKDNLDNSILMSAFL